MDELIRKLNELIVLWETHDPASPYSPHAEGVETGYFEADYDLRKVVEEYRKLDKDYLK